MRSEELETPALILDRSRLIHNIETMTQRIAGYGVHLRPHLKTAKAIDIARLALQDNFGGITVSTLNEAEYFAGHGIRDILYAVCISPDKLPRAAAMIRRGIDLKVIVDNPETARALIAYAEAHAAPFPVLIEIDSGEHRTGLNPDHENLLEIGHLLAGGRHTRLAGVMTHAGHAYRCQDVAEIKTVARQERAAALTAVGRLREDGLACPLISIGSTPTAVHTDNLNGVTEVRAGVYMMGDLFQAGIQSCQIEDIALTVLSTVISHRTGPDRIMLDAGALALSKDLGNQRDGYGRILDPTTGRAAPGLKIHSVHQEHGELRSEQGPLAFDNFPVGTRVRVLPNHACMTAAMYPHYHVVDQDAAAVEAIWPRTNGWARAGQ